MKKNILSLLLLVIASISQAQDWTWMKGTDTLTQPGIYGTIGVPSPSNNPGSRHGAATWVDNSGNLWMFGGEGVTTNTVLCWLNDMWRYNPINNRWTWVRGTNLPNQNGIYGTKGVPSTTNEPGAREFMMSWTDAAGNFWLFGGEGFPATGGIGGLNDLWRYNPTTNEWTWMSGANVIDDPGIYGTKGVAAPTNVPGARHGSGATTDASGNLWLFGGYGNPATTVPGNLNDLWKYNIGTNQWTWVSGTNLTNQFGNYGTLTVSSPTNHPGGREFPSCWTDKNNDIWLFGGGGFASASPQGHTTDLWKYTVSTNSWAWMNGANTVNQQGVYGTQYVSAPGNAPGSRFAAASWTDAVGNLWLFGGTGYATAVVPGRLNDLWRYNPAINEWSWEHGMNFTNANGNYGIQTVPAPFTTPGGRYYNTWWKPTNGYFYLFGGLGFGALGNTPNNLNDLWRYQPPCNATNLTSSGELTICSGSTTTLTAASTGSGTISWYNGTSTVALATGTTFVTPTLSAVGSQTAYTYYAESSLCPGLVPITITVNPLPTVTVAPTPSVCSGYNSCLNAGGATTYTWAGPCGFYMLGQSPCFTFNLACTCTYTVFGEDANGCQNTATLCLNLVPSPVLNITSSNSLICSGQTATLTSAGALSYTWNPSGSGTNIVVSPSVTSNYTVTGTAANSCTAAAYFTQNVSACTGITYFNHLNVTYQLIPNPNNGAFKITNSDEAEFVVYNALGQEVHKQHLNEGETLVNTTLAKGVYLYLIQQKEQTLKSGKLIIE